MQIAKNNSKCSKQKKKSKTKPKKSEVRDVRKKHMQKIEFYAGVMFGKKHGQVPKKGFSLETSSHKCRGCQKNMPLNQSTLIPSIIDLTLD